jgi:hypothetical protein
VSGARQHFLALKDLHFRFRNNATFKFEKFRQPKKSRPHFRVRRSLSQGPCSGRPHDLAAWEKLTTAGAIKRL